MSTPYIGQITYFPYLRGAPQGWLACDGSTQSIAAYQTLFQLIGTTYGGDGQSTFGLPDLRGRVPIGVSNTYPIAAQQGSETVTLNTNQIPNHNHAIQVNTGGGGSGDPTGNVFATGVALYTAPPTPSLQPMATTATGPTGNNVPHNNCAPTIAIVACIATDGIYPSQN